MLYHFLLCPTSKSIYPLQNALLFSAFPPMFKKKKTMKRKPENAHQTLILIKQKTLRSEKQR